MSDDAGTYVIEVAQEAIGSDADFIITDLGSGEVIYDSGDQ